MFLLSLGREMADIVPITTILYETDEYQGEKKAQLDGRRPMMNGAVVVLVHVVVDVVVEYANVSAKPYAYIDIFMHIIITLLDGSKQFG